MNYKPELLPTVLMMCVLLCRLDPSPFSIWSNPPGSAEGRPNQPPRATLTVSTRARHQRATPKATRSTVLLQPSRPEPPHSPALPPTTSLPLSKAPTVQLCPTTLSDTLSPPNRAPALGRWLSTAQALGPARRRRGEPTKAVCLRQPNAYTGWQGGQCLNCSLVSFYKAKRQAQGLHPSGQTGGWLLFSSLRRKDWKVQPNRHLYVCACVYVCVCVCVYVC